MDATKRAPWGLLIGAIIVAVMGVFVFLEWPRPNRLQKVDGVTEARADREQASSSVTKDERRASGSGMLRAERSAGASVQSTNADLYAAYRCQKAPCDASPFIATSEQEAIWLSENGYPSPRQVEEARVLSTSTLKANALKGAPSDLALYAERLGQEGQWGESLGVLGAAVKKGSIYALYGLATVYAESPQHQDALKSKAYLRAANLSGDSKAVYVYGSWLPKYNSLPEQVIVDREAANIHRNLMHNKLAPRP